VTRLAAALRWREVERLLLDLLLVVPHGTFAPRTPDERVADHAAQVVAVVAKAVERLPDAKARQVRALLADLRSALKRAADADRAAAA
jgi:hypothetical protein